MPLSKGFTDELKDAAALAIIGSPASEQMDITFGRLDQHTDIPFRLYASFPTPNTLLNIGSNQVQAGDGAKKSTAPLSDKLQVYPGAAINFQTAAITGSGVVQTASATFTLPTTTIGQFRRMCLTYVSETNTVNTAFSSAYTSLALLQAADPALDFALLDGNHIGYIELEATGANAFKTAGSATAIIENSVSSVGRIYRFGFGSGGGSGTGNASDITESMRNMLDTMSYNLATPVDFTTSKSTLVDAASTGSYFNKFFLFASAAQTLVTKALSDSELTAAPNVISEVDLSVFWDLTRLDTAAVYSVSRDDGVEYQTVTMSRLGTSNAFTGNMKFLEEAVKQTLSSQTVGATNFAINTTTAQRIAQSFTLASASVVKSVDLKVIRTGSAVGRLMVSVVKNSGGIASSLDADILSESSVGYDISTIPTSATVITVAIPAVALAAGTYHIAVRTIGYAATYSAGVTQVALLTDAAVNGMSVYNLTTYEDSALNGAYCVVTGSVLALRLKVIASASGKALSGYGLLYDKNYNGIVKGVENYERADFKAVAANTSTFTLSRFLPNQKFLRVYHVQKAQVMVWPSFSVSGYQVIFPTDTFKNDGVETDVTLIFDQSVGQSDASDSNASNIALLQSGSAEIDDKVVLGKLTAVNGTPGAGQFRSTISGRAQMVDLSADLLPRLGVERIMTQAAMRVDGEIGPAGEAVYKPVNDKFDQIRFGNSPNNQTGGWGRGSAVYLGNTGDFFEITFYGTGLNILSLADPNTRAVRISTDGVGATDITVATGSTSGILGNRNYASNAVVNLVSGLSLGVHTVKGVIQSGFSCWVHGFEILNEGSVGGTNNPCTGNITTTSNQLTTLSNVAGIVAGMTITGTGIPASTTVLSISGTTVTMSANATATTVGLQVTFTGAVLRTPPGSAVIDGVKRTLSAVDYQMYNTGFESGTLGTRGGRAVMYMKADGTIKKSFTPAGSQLNLTSANHTNEEVIRNYFWREFGAGRTDDFSTLSNITSSRTFTTDDGATTLTGTFAGATTDSTIEALYHDATGTGSFTFVGTGLNLFIVSSSARTFNTMSIDGVSLGSVTSTPSIPSILPIVSGLPYGTHVLSWTIASGVAGPRIANFIVYGPKKPSIPSGAMELADYNIMADYVANTTAGVDTIASGVLRKSTGRECVFSGTWVFASTPGTYVAYGQAGSSATSSYVELAFFGTGVELRGQGNTVFTAAPAVIIDGLAATTANFPSLVSSAYGGWSFSAGSMSQAGSNTLGSGVSIRGLTLGFHKIRMTAGTAASMVLEAIDIITPIHVHKSNGPFVLQNTLSVGSQGINDSRKFGNQLTPFRNAAQAIGISSAVTTTSTTSFVPLTDLACVIDCKTGLLDLKTILSWGNPVAAVMFIQFFIDGAAAGTVITHIDGNTNAGWNVTTPQNLIIPVSIGRHYIQVMWKSGGGTLNGSGTERILTATDIG